MISSCTIFSRQDQAVLKLIECTPKQQKNVPKVCAATYNDHVFEGNFVNLRSRFIGNFVSSASLEIKLGLKTVMCKTEVNKQNHSFIQKLKKGDLVRVMGTITTITRFKNSKYNYISIENCSVLF